MAISVGNSQMSSISSLIAASSSSRVFAGFFKVILSPARNGTTAFGYPRERMFLNSGPLSLWLSATGAVLKRRAVVHRVKDVVALMFHDFGPSRRHRSDQTATP